MNAMTPDDPDIGLEIHDGRFTIADTTYHLIMDGPGRVSDSEGLTFNMWKSTHMMESYIALRREFHGCRLFELGIRDGGSTAFLVDYLEPAHLVAVELDPQPLVALQSHIDRAGRADTVRPYYGVDQGDRARLTEILAEEFGDQPLDLVIDDASHQLDLTRSSFETLFPAVRPGGLYVIEDWAAQHRLTERVTKQMLVPGSRAHKRLAAILTERAAQQDRPDSPPAQTVSPASEKMRPLASITTELMLVQAGRRSLIDQIRVDPYWISIRRGPEPIDQSSFRLRDAYLDPYGLTAT